MTKITKKVFDTIMGKDNVIAKIPLKLVSMPLLRKKKEKNFSYIKYFFYKKKGYYISKYLKKKEPKN